MQYIKLLLFSLSLTLILTYLCLSFVELSFNITQWHIATRLLAVVIIVGSTVFIVKDLNK